MTILGALGFSCGSEKDDGVEEARLQGLARPEPPHAVLSTASTPLCSPIPVQKNNKETGGEERGWRRKGGRRMEI